MYDNQRLLLKGIKYWQKLFFSQYADTAPVFWVLNWIWYMNYLNVKLKVKYRIYLSLFYLAVKRHLIISPPGLSLYSWIDLKVKYLLYCRRDYIVLLKGGRSITEIRGGILKLVSLSCWWEMADAGVPWVVSSLLKKTLLWCAGTWGAGMPSQEIQAPACPHP